MPGSPEEFFAELADSGRRLPLDRYRDFRQVFLGSDAGKRVLHDICVQGHLYKISAVLHGHSPHPQFETYFREGERNIALWILGTLNKEPMAAPTKQNVREVDDVP